MNKAQITALAVTAEPGIDVAFVKGSNQFQNWLTSVSDKFVIKSLHLQSVDIFGKGDKARLGFVKFKADVTDQKGAPLSGIVFMRGGAVGMLVVVNKTHAIMTVQPRVATGDFEFVELPAGMLDGSGNFAGVAAKEIEEELDLKIPADKLTDLGAVTGSSSGYYPSAGGSDETIRLFCYNIEVSDAELAAMNGKATGAIDEDEQIALKIMPLEEIWKLPDSKAAVAYLYYQKLQARKVAADLSAGVVEGLLSQAG